VTNNTPKKARRFAGHYRKSRLVTPGLDDARTTCIRFNSIIPLIDISGIEALEELK